MLHPKFIELYILLSIKFEVIVEVSTTDYFTNYYTFILSNFPQHVFSIGDIIPSLSFVANVYPVSGDGTTLM